MTTSTRNCVPTWPAVSNPSGDSHPRRAALPSWPEAASWLLVMRKPLIEASRTDDHEIEEERTKIAEP